VFFIFSVSYKGKDQPTPVHDESNASSATPPEEWPPHARKPKQTTGFKIFMHFDSSLFNLLLSSKSMVPSVMCSK
jgi:hypothetical protein